jgi:hypothetical protein
LQKPATHAGRPEDDLGVWERNLDVNYGLLKIAPTVALVEPPWDTNEILQLFGPAAVIAAVGAQL